MPTTEPVTAQRIETFPDALIIVLNDQQRIRIEWQECSRRLAGATEAQRIHAELSPGGYGIHWPLLDEDLSINGLLRARR